MARRLKLPRYEDILNMSKKELTRQLNRLRPTVARRINRLKEAGKLSYLRNIGKLNKTSTPREELAEITSFLRKPFSEVSNIKKFERDMLKQLHDHGYDIDPDDITEFNDFMAEVKAMHKGRRIPDSTRVVEAFIQAKRLKMSRKALITNLDYWREHLEEMQELSSSRSKTNYSAKYIEERIRKLKK